MSPLNHHQTTTAAICFALTCLFQGSVHLLGLNTQHFIFCLILIANAILIMNKNSHVKKSFIYKVLSCYSVPGEKRCFNVTYKEPGRNRVVEKTCINKDTDSVVYILQLNIKSMKKEMDCTTITFSINKMLHMIHVSP